MPKFQTRIYNTTSIGLLIELPIPISNPGIVLCISVMSEQSAKFCHVQHCDFAIQNGTGR